MVPNTFERGMTHASNGRIIGPCDVDFASLQDGFSLISTDRNAIDLFLLQPQADRGRRLDRPGAELDVLDGW
jgi:hypothetical protein